MGFYCFVLFTCPSFALFDNEVSNDMYQFQRHLSLSVHYSVGEKDENDKDFSFAKSYIFLLSSITMRGWNVKPKKASVQIAFLCLTFFGLLLYYHWEAMLISYLSTRFTVMPFNSIPELIRNTDFEISVLQGSSLMDTFKHSNDFYWQQSWQTRIKPNLNKFKDFNTDEFIDYISENDGVAHYDNYLAVRTFDAYVRCEIKAIRAKYDVKPLAFGFQKDSSLLNLFDYHLKEMKESGALDQIMKKYESGGQNCPDMSGQPLGFDSCFLAFLALIGGSMVGLILMGLEYLSGERKSIPYLDSYGGLIFNETDPKQMENILNHKRSLMYDLKLEILHLESKLHGTQN